MKLRNFDIHKFLQRLVADDFLQKMVKKRFETVATASVKGELAP